ncbi:MAG: alpha/beta fold hydrolase [Kofleriaceae bacterium]
MRVAVFVAVLALATFAEAKKPRWQTLPLPPAMPEAASSGTVAHEGARIFYATYGDAKRDPVILLHGGMGNSDHFAFQLPALVDKFWVIVVDSRGQGRSSLSKGKLTYHAMGTDVIAVMDALKVPKASLAGWSDGGAIALDLAITAPDRVNRIFIIGTNYDSNGSKRRKSKPTSTTFSEYAAKCRRDHQKLGNKPASWQSMIDALLPVWRNPAGFTKDQLKSINAPTLVALGDHDEIIEQAQIEEMAILIPNGKVHIFRDTSHFAMWQDPESVNAALVEFLSAR